jgi:RimJ/RimL family protein N-acetyltransferase
MSDREPLCDLPPVLRTARLDLVAATAAHLEAELEAPERLGRMLGVRVPAGWPPGLHDHDAIRFFCERLRSGGASAIGWYVWYVVRRAAGKHPAVLVASVGYFGPPEAGTVEIGFSVVDAYRREGIATEAIGALTARALAIPGTKQVLAHTAADNVASRMALRRAGFTETGAGAEPGSRRFAQSP